MHAALSVKTRPEKHAISLMITGERPGTSILPRLGNTDEMEHLKFQVSERWFRNARK